MFCENCGTQCADNLAACPNCSAPLRRPSGSPSGASSGSYAGNPSGGYAPAPPLSSFSQIPSEYKPISMWGYFGYKWLFAIPVVGLVILIVLAVSSHNVNLKNFARSYFCDLIICLVVLAIITVIIVATGGTAALMGYFYDMF